MGVKLFGPPDKLRIPAEDPEYARFDFVGRCGAQQVLAFVSGAFPDGYPWQRYADPQNRDWRRDKRWLAVIHVFDGEGNHTGSGSRLGGYDIEGRDIAGEKASAQLARMLQELGPVKPADIYVKLFSVVMDNVTHGLFYTHFVEDEDEAEWVMLKPRDVMFHPPWDSGQTSS
jgi:hypothetical protein